MNANRHNIRLTAEQDAQNDVNKLLWFVVGFALSVIGILIAYIYQQSPPASRLFDKSQEFTVFYSDAYKANSRKIQVKYAVIGFLITAIFFLLYIFFMFSLYRRMMYQIQSPF